MGSQSNHLQRFLLGGVLLLLIAGCSRSSDQLLTLVEAEDMGIDFQNDITETNDLNILDYLYFYNGGGVSVGDINNDGWPDIFFSGNQVKNKLYLNEGNLQFKDISESAGIEGQSSWNTGSVMGDINGDGLLDIYVCAVVGLNGFIGHNELYINNGPSADSGQVTFTEQSAAYGLDFDTYSSGVALLDYDLDGDLDIYLLNHAVHTQESFGKVDLRYKRDPLTGDKLLRNDNGYFTDVSESAGIYGGINGYGLGVAVSDFNKDGWPDIYVGNDFHEDDYYYLNNGPSGDSGEVTFTESVRTYFGHTSRFSMGNDVADINHDGWPDLISLDMLAEDEKVIKSSEGDDNVQVQKLRTEKYGYHHQFTRNTLNVNQKGGTFLETALLSGVAATDWSWSALFADFDLDSAQDLFISNGIPRRPNDLDFINFTSNEQIQKKLNNTKLVDQKALEMMPPGKTHNYVFKGKKDLEFQDMSGKWIPMDTLVSGATALGDLDNDGDLDVVTNNLDSSPGIYVNNAPKTSHFLKIRLKFTGKNPFAVGSKVYSYHKGIMQYKELFPARGFQASSEYMIHFGYGATETVDSLRIVWPNSTSQVLHNISTDQTLEITPDAPQPHSFTPEIKQPLFRQVKGNLGIDYKHREDSYIDFNRQKLMPFKHSDRGPGHALLDINGDGALDILWGGSHHMPNQLFVWKDTSFVEAPLPNTLRDSVMEVMEIGIADIDGNGGQDILLGTGGSFFFNDMPPLLDRVLLQGDTEWAPSTIPDSYSNTSVISVFDYDGDGDKDFFCGNLGITNDYGQIPTSHLYVNENGILKSVPLPKQGKLGMLTDALWDDVDNDGAKDLIIIGEWMSPQVLYNRNGQLQDPKPIVNGLDGLWQSLIAHDIDRDGDQDYILGNWGSNAKFKASKEHPMKMYYGDFDGNGQTETLVTIEKNGRYYPLENSMDILSQLQPLRKKYPNYADFAGKDIQEILGDAFKDAQVLEVQELRSGYLLSKEGGFEFRPFQNELQVSPIMALVEHDFDADGENELLAAGNYFGVKPLQGRFDSFPGALIDGEKSVLLTHGLGLDLAQKSVRHLSILQSDGKEYLLVTVNNGAAIIYQIK